MTPKLLRGAAFPYGPEAGSGGATAASFEEEAQ